MHGGEPLLAGLEYIKTFQDILTTNVPNIKLELGIQTNGVLLNNEILDFCVSNNISIGLSMDGDREANDLHRLDHQGKSSFSSLEKTLELLSSDRGRKIWTGFLCTIDINNDPERVYSYLSPYSPEFNPIEHLWWELKAWLRRFVPRSVQIVEKLLELGVKLCSTKQIENYFSHCCYCTS